MVDSSNKFNIRGFVSVTAALAFVGLAFTGVILFVTPPGRIANWTGWQILGLTKQQWTALHIWFGAVFLVTALLHIYYNWRVLIQYLKHCATHRFALRKEWIMAVLLFVVILVGTLKEVPPFSSLLNLNDRIKLSWERADELAPIPHAELLSLRELADETQADLQTILSNLQQHGIKVESPDVILGTLAKNYQLTPNELYQKAMTAPGTEPTSKGRGTNGRGMGLGRLTLQAYCAQEGLDLQQALDKLQQAGINATKDMTMRDIAMKNNLKPYDVLDILQRR